MDPAAFFELHQGLPREGPGCAEEVVWGIAQAGISGACRVLDAGSGPGGDIAALRAALPEAEIVAIDSHVPFIENLNQRFADDPGVLGVVGDMMDAKGPFDLIWCAGAIYFVGVTEALRRWQGILAPGGRVCFSQACLFCPDPPEAVATLFEGYPITDATGIAAQVSAAGFEFAASKPVSDAAWEAYYAPQQQRIAALRPTASPTLNKVLDEAETEMSIWRKHRREFGYLLVVARMRGQA
jgi:SAM-dependent methyltransferase